MISLGVLAGTKKAIQGAVLKPGRFDSSIVATSGKNLDRLALETAMAFNFPLWTEGNTFPMATKPNCISWPANKAVVCGAPPLYGTCTILTPVIFLKISPDICCDVPWPGERNETLSGLLFARSINSFTDLTERFGCVTSSKGVTANFATGAKSF